jgi:GNAT superfamily N-acetyltransferase
MENDLENIELRTVKPGELLALLDLYQHLHEIDFPLPDERTIQDVWDEITHDPKIWLFVAVHNAGLIGSCILTIIPNLTRGARPYGIIENVVTHAGYRKRGIGTKLLQRALNTSWEKNCYKVMLLTGSKQEALLHFYEKAGFVRGIKTGFIAYPADKSKT